MRIPFSMRAGAVLAAAALFLSLGLEAPLARGGPSFGRPVIGPAIGHGFGHGLRPRFPDAGRVSRSFRNPDGLRRFDRFAGFNRFGRSRFFRNGNGFFNGGYWYWPYAYGSASAGAGGGGGPVIVVVGAPSFNDPPTAANQSADAGPEGGCVIHKLNYNASGRYLGESQSPHC